MRLSTILFAFLLPLALAVPAAQDESAEAPPSEGGDPSPGGDDGGQGAFAADAVGGRRTITCTAKADVYCRTCPYYPTCPGKFQSEPIRPADY